jgi:3-hydroxyisobutyrate dehydrogenase-like beta-hydroxyacid dehydrogenase
MTVRKVALIGVGQMGGPMARNIHKAGFELTVCDRDSTALAPFAALGVRCTAHAADCADSDVVVVLVATPEQTHAVLLGPGGVMEGVYDQAPLVAVMGTIAPSEMTSLAEALGAKGIAVVDAPVSGGTMGAEDGTLAIMVGGTDDAFERLRPLMESMGKAIYHCGSLGTGQVTKIVNNIGGVMTQMIAAEAYRICLENGLKLGDAIPVYEAGTGRNFMTRDVGDVIRAYTSWTSRRLDFDNLQAIMRKDIGLALSIGKTSGPLPMLHALQAVLGNAGEETFENWSRIASARSTPS